MAAKFAGHMKTGCAAARSIALLRSDPGWLAMARILDKCGDLALRVDTDWHPVYQTLARCADNARKLFNGRSRQLVH